MEVYGVLWPSCWMTFLGLHCVTAMFLASKTNGAFWSFPMPQPMASQCAPLVQEQWLARLSASKTTA